MEKSPEANDLYPYQPNTLGDVLTVMLLGFLFLATPTLCVWWVLSNSECAKDGGMMALTARPPAYTCVQMSASPTNTPKPQSPSKP